ncbi:DUF3617 domain-containing protein [Qipengyuania nanhaisediminis]|uniref:DUF3617 domain-containing protein n=1 Tax=Qipengyuania nanhaisediminis TaxID=604088 RepID=UPI0038B297D1
MTHSLAAAAGFAGLCALSLALGACSDGAIDADSDGDGEVSREEMAAASDAMSDQVKPLPGEYRATVNFIEADIAGAPPEMMEMIGNQMSSTRTFCMTPEMADEGFGEAMQEGQGADNCTVNKMTIDSGTMDMAMTCSDPQVGEMRISMNGDVSPTRSDVTMVSQGTFGPLGEGRMEMNFVQERIGDCEG